jgi:Uncharacterised nucleotidyltransferase
MSTVVSTLPSTEVLDRQLREITEVLAQELAVPSKAPPIWTDFQWRIARAVAVMQGVAPLLAKQSQWPNSTGWHRFLCDQGSHVAGRHRRIEHLLGEIDMRARKMGVALVALKGAALHAIGIYAAGERPMADIDLLVCDSERVSAHQLLRDCDFELTFANSRHELFEPRIKRPLSVEHGEHLDNPLKIELHTSIREQVPVTEIDITQFVFPVPSGYGICPYRSTGALMMHLLLHAAGNMRAHALRHVQLHDIARLAARMDKVDWEELLTLRPSNQPIWWAAPPLIMTARYFTDSVPESVIRVLEKECTWLLRTRARRQLLADVSWSNVRIYALPGIEWCKSIGDVLGFIRARAIPDREMRANLRHVDTHDASSSAVPWYGISQTARILRWVFSRPPRVQTLMAVRSALAQNRGE